MIAPKDNPTAPGPDTRPGRAASDTSVATVVTATLVAVATVLLGALGAINYAFESRAAHQRLATDAATKADQLAAGLALAMWNFDRPQTDRVIESAMSDPNVFSVEVRQADVAAPGGISIYRRARGPDWGVITPASSPNTHGMVVEERHVAASGTDLGGVSLAVSPHLANATLRQTLVALVTRIVVLDAVLVLILWVLLRRTVLLPLRALGQYAAAVSSGGGAGATCDPRGRFYGELGCLRGSIEKMVGQLDARYAALRESEATLAGILDSVPLSIFWKDRDGHYLGCNQLFARSVGVANPLAIVGKTDRDLPWPAADREKYLADDRDVIATKRTKRHMLEPVRLASGDTLWVDTTKVPLVNPDGVAYGVLGVYEDVTERIETEERLREAKQFTEQVVANMQDGLVVLDRDLRFRVWNPKMEEISGVRGDEMLGRHALEEFPFLGQAGVVDLMRRALAGENGLSREFRWHIPRTGRTGWSWQMVGPLRSSAGEIVGVLSTVRDITKRKEAEEALLREKALTDAVFDNVPAVLSLYHEDGRLVRWNRRSKEITGWSDEELATRRVGDAQPADEQGTIASAVRQVLQHGHARIEASLSTKAGGRIPFYYSGVRVMLDGKPHILSIGLDISERKRTEAVLLESEKMRTVAGLAAGMAHEINNPLAGMVQNAQVVLNRLRPDLPANHEAARRAGTSIEAIAAYMKERGIPAMLEAIRQSGQRGADVVSNMLSFSRGGDAQPSLCDLGELLDDAVALATSDYDVAGIDFRNVLVKREYGAGVPSVRCRPAELQQVVLNLLKNSAQAMSAHRNGKRPTIAIRTAFDAPARSVRVEIEDNGPGMPETVRQRAFEPFYTTKGPRDGAGLGLFVSYCIVTRNHAGTIAIDSVEGEGTKFTMTLPAGGPP